MPDEYSSIFSSDPSTGALTYPQLEARRRIAIALATRNRPYPKTIGEGLTALGEGLGEGYMNRGLERAEGAQRARDTAATSLLMGGAPPAAAPGRVSEAAPEEALPPAVATADAQPPSMPIEEWKQRIARNESGGAKDAYSLVGERSRRGDYPYGKYQVMGENVPKWTKQFVGREMTPEEFLADKDAQETVATGMGGKYLAKYGPEGAGAAWFAGEKGMNDPNRKDTLGTHVAEYRRRFNIPLVSRDQVVASAARTPAAAPPSAFATAPEMPPEAASAMAYAPEGAAAEGAEGLGAGMLANLTNPQPPGLGLRGPSDSTFPAPAAPAVSRDSIAAAVAAQNGIVPPQQVAAGPAPLPQAPPAAPSIAPQPAPQAPPQPVSPGPEPQLRSFIEGNPQLKTQMDNARRIALDPGYSPQIQAQAQAAYSELEKRANDAFTKQWTIWHERTKTKEAWDLAAESRQQTRETHQQKTIPGVGGAQAPGQPQPGQDPRIGTPASPQRTGVPSPDPMPAGVSPEKWSEQQTKRMASANEAVEKAVPAFDDAIKAIQLARQHPGREFGVGVTGDIAQKLPWTDAAGFGKIMEQIKGKNFLSGYQLLKGGGSITEIEGSKTEQAQARVSTAQKMDDWKKAMDDLELSMRRDLELAQRKVNHPVTAWRAPGDNASYAPDVGERRGDKEYIGGNPADPMSWKRTQ
jgi:hypothetical protein